MHIVHCKFHIYVDMAYEKKRSDDLMRRALLLQRSSSISPNNPFCILGSLRS